jgi:nicotinate-nucleotide adenylyltransferase
MRIGYFGGTFDPPHTAHLHAAQAAADAFRLDRILFAPTGVQPLKDAGPKAGFEDRLAMARLLCADDPRMAASDLDAPHPDGTPNFTIDALKRLQSQQPGDEIFVLVGADSFLTLPRWRDPVGLLAAAQWIVLSRPGFSLDDLSPLALTPEQLGRVHLLMELDEETSSSGIRERLRVGVSCGTMLTPAVSLYIARMHLYHDREQ